MPGFVDVTGMTALEVKRLGQIDDYDFAPQPLKQSQTSFLIDHVWAAAVAAQRINGDYIKDAVYDYPDHQQVLVKESNRTIMLRLLSQPGALTESDITAGQELKEALQSSFTFRAMQNKTTSFDQAINRCLELQNPVYSVAHRFELSVIASLPNSIKRTQRQQAAQERINFARGGFVGKPGEKINTRIEVLSSNYSQTYNVFWIRAITDQDQPVFFSFKRQLTAGDQLLIQGTVKAHKNDITQLNRVKIL